MIVLREKMNSFLFFLKRECIHVLNLISLSLFSFPYPKPKKFPHNLPSLLCLLPSGLTRLHAWSPLGNFLFFTLSLELHPSQFQPHFSCILAKFQLQFGTSSSTALLPFIHTLSMAHSLSIHIFQKVNLSNRYLSLLILFYSTPSVNFHIPRYAVNFVPPSTMAQNCLMSQHLIIHFE